jgi:hypothetical protein
MHTCTRNYTEVPLLRLALMLGWKRVAWPRLMQPRRSESNPTCAISLFILQRRARFDMYTVRVLWRGTRAAL